MELLVNKITKKYPDVALHTAINGSTGLELFKKQTSDIVITDIHIPEMGGMQIAGKIHAIKTDTKFIVLTCDIGKLRVKASSEKALE